ncbi:hypothetical protein Scep_007677 [Stephania cephalantha]|uniref:Uncharacterized protein n=1 Tax=Stephania cephalantha TaxID=152367 RepID=A0AAP0KCZ7_9MAGN
MRGSRGHGSTGVPALTTTLARNTRSVEQQQTRKEKIGDFFLAVRRLSSLIFQRLIRPGLRWTRGQIDPGYVGRSDARRPSSPRDAGWGEQLSPIRLVRRRVPEAPSWLATPANPMAEQEWGAVVSRPLLRFLFFIGVEAATTAMSLSPFSNDGSDSPPSSLAAATLPPLSLLFVYSPLHNFK